MGWNRVAYFDPDDLESLKQISKHLGAAKDFYMMMEDDREDKGLEPDRELTYQLKEVRDLLDEVSERIVELEKDRDDDLVL